VLFTLIANLLTNKFAVRFEKTGRLVSIAVTRSDKRNTHTVLMNHINYPNVFLWSAVVASCALPGYSFERYTHTHTQKKKNNQEN